MTGLGFDPKLLFLNSFQNVAQASPVGEARLGWGATDATTELSLSIQDKDSVLMSDVDGVAKTGKVFVKVDNHSQTIDAEADLTSFDDDGFTLNWTTNDAVATEMLYLALGSLAPTAITLQAFNAAHHHGGVLLSWRTGLDVNNLGWHIYRSVAGKRVRLTPALIAGSALMFGPGLQLQAGNGYTWWDPAGDVTDQYWIEDHDLGGQRTLHGPVQPVRTEQPLPKTRHAPFLSQVGRQQRRSKASATRSTGRGRHPHPLTASHMITSSKTLAPWEQANLPPHAVQRALAAAPAIKLNVWERGWYRVTQPDLVRAGLDPRVDPRHLQLFVQGKQLAILVTGEQDGRFEPQDAVEFYGEGIKTSWTDVRPYWLVAGSRPGTRVHMAPSQRPRAMAPQSFATTIEDQERRLYLPFIKNGDAQNFFGPVIAQEPVERVLSVHHLDANSPAGAQLEVALQGVTPGAHQVAVQLNGHDVGTIALAGQTRHVGDFLIPPTWLRDGDNVVALIPAGQGDRVSVMDHIRFTYRHTYTADGDTLRGTAPGDSRVAITGFCHPDIRVVDITDRQATRGLRGRVAVQGDRAAVTVTTHGEGNRTLFAFTNAQVKRPAAIVVNAPSTWHDSTHAAELIMISHRAFVESIAPLKAVRESQGWRVALVDVEDVYDAFNFGLKSPWALRDFLRQAYTTWAVAPRFVLLVGDASFDPLNHLDMDAVDFVPTPLVETAFLETASDDGLVDFDADGVPELAVGRLPVQTVAEAATVVSKLVGYVEAAPTGAWSREVLMVADAGNAFDFTEASLDVAALLPTSLRVEALLPERTEVPQLRRNLLTHLNEGKVLVNYMGHGSTEIWAGGALFASADARALTNGGRLPLVVAMNCLNGFFHDLYTESLGEALLKAKHGGAVAVWASSGLTPPPGQVAMNRELVRHLFGERGLTLVQPGLNMLPV